MTAKMSFSKSSGKEESSSKTSNDEESSSEKSDDDWKRFCDAAQAGRLEEVIKLSSRFNNDMVTLNEALRDSCYDGHLDVLKWLMEHTAADVNYNRGRWTPLTAASYYGHLDIVKYLVENCHADVNLPDSDGDIPLTMACRFVNISVSMYFLLEVSDLDVNITDINSDTALHLAVWRSKDYNTQIHKACIISHESEVLRLVYARNHEINAQDNIGCTPLHIACDWGYSAIVEILMLAGADMTITNDDGMTPVQVVESRRHYDLLKLLDRENLWQVMIGRRKKFKLSIIVLIMLTSRLMMQRQMTKE